MTLSKEVFPEPDGPITATSSIGLTKPELFYKTCLYEVLPSVIKTGNGSPLSFLRRGPPYAFNEDALCATEGFAGTKNSMSFHSSSALSLGAIMSSGLILVEEDFLPLISVGAMGSSSMFANATSFDRELRDDCDRDLPIAC